MARSSESLPVTMAPTWRWLGLRTELWGSPMKGRGPTHLCPLGLVSGEGALGVAKLTLVLPLTP